jgi:hypothetical protein
MKGFAGRAGSVAHGLNVCGPRQISADIDAEISDVFRGTDDDVAVGRVAEDEALNRSTYAREGGRGGVEEGLSKGHKLSLIWVSSQAVAE